MHLNLGAFREKCRNRGASESGGQVTTIKFSHVAFEFRVANLPNLPGRMDDAIFDATSISQ
jgi:hypothetical protein